jgi:RimJ/RimL family protein N-acetyltransferase
MISIRRIHLGEGQLFKELRLASLKESPSAFSSTYESALGRSRKSWNEQADSTAEGKDRCTFIAFSDGFPVGIAAIYRDNKKKQEGEILQVWVSPDFRGSRVAGELVETILQWSEENGFQRVLAKVTPGNDRALRFYKKCGFDFAGSTSYDALGNLVLVKEIIVEQAHAPGALPRACDEGGRS